MIKMAKVSTNLSCPECEADFNVKHDMDSKMYVPKYCAFCGEEIVSDDDDLSIDFNEDEDDE